MVGYWTYSLYTFGQRITHITHRCFLGQCPLAALSLILLLWRLPSQIGNVTEQETLSIQQKASRIDFAGFVILPIALTTTFISLDLAGKLQPWTYIAPSSLAAVALFAIFYYVERSYAKEPIIPMDLIIKPDVMIPYFLVFVQTAAQFVVGMIDGRLTSC